MKPSVLIVAGASAVGKTTVSSLLLESGKFELVRSVTTREMRSDSFGSEYIYLSREEFLRRIEAGDVLEHTEYSGNLYGTPKSEIERIFGEGRIPLLILDLNGVRSLSESGEVEACAVYIYDDLSVMERRLRERYLDGFATEDGFEKYKRRTEQNISDYLVIDSYSELFYAFLKNKATPSDSAAELLSIFESFLEGKAKDATENFRVAKILRESARKKQ